MRVALVNPPWKKDGWYGVRAGSRWPHFEKNGSRYMPFPFFLAYAAALLEKDGFEVSIFDGCATREKDEEFRNRVMEFRPSLIIQENATASINTDIRWAKELKYSTRAFLLMVGHHVDFMKDDLNKYIEINALAGGEWEFTALECARRLRRSANLEGVKGLVHRNLNNNIIDEGTRENISDIDALPFPHRYSLDMRKYYDNPGDLPEPNLQIMGSRGCPYGCNFCVWPQVVYKNRKYRARSAKNICDELEYELKHGQIEYKSYYFDDDTFNIGNSRLMRLADEIMKRGLSHIPWGAMCRTDTFKKETLMHLRRAGLRFVKYGIESGNQRLVDRCGKKLKLDQARSMIYFTKSIGIKTHLTFSFGLIGENKKTLKETLDFALNTDPESVQFSICTPFPGTRFYNYAVDNDLLLNKDYSAYDGTSNCIAKTDELSADELENYLVYAEKAWELHRLRRGGFLARAIMNPKKIIKKAISDPKSTYSIIAEYLSKGSKNENSE